MLIYNSEKLGEQTKTISTIPSSAVLPTSKEKIKVLLWIYLLYSNTIICILIKTMICYVLLDSITINGEQNEKENCWFGQYYENYIN